MRGGNQGHTSVIADSCFLGFDQLRDFGIGSVEGLELFEAAGPHAGLVERAIVGKDVLMATAREDCEDTQTGKQHAGLHELYCSGRKPGRNRVCLGG